jgi:hypothetical protein
MLKPLLTSVSLAAALLVLPLGGAGTLTGSGAAGLSPAHAIDIGVDGGLVLGGGPGGPWFGVGVGDDDDDDDYDYDDGYYDALRDADDWDDDWDD